MTQQQKQLLQTSKKLSKINNQVVANRKNIRQLSQSIAELDQKKKKSNDQITRLRQQLMQQLKMALWTQLDSPVKSLLSTHDAQAMSRLATYQAYLARHQQQLINKTQRAVQQLERLKLQSQAQAEQLARQQQTLNEQLKQLKGSEKSKRELIVSIQKRNAGRKKQLQKLEQDRQRLQRLLKDIGLAISELSGGEAPRFSSLKGRLKKPTNGKVIRNFGEKRQGGGRWQGLLLESKGSIKSVASGRVVYADWLRGYGMLIIVDHGQGYMSLYGQNDALYRDVGDWVQSGEEIAKAGFDPEIKQKVCYFEIRKNASAINPKSWLKRG